MKTVKSRLFKKQLKRRKLWARFCSTLDWLNIREKNIIENYNSVGAGAHKVEKVVSFWPNFDPNLEIVKQVNYIYEKFGLITFKEI